MNNIFVIFKEVFLTFLLTLISILFYYSFYSITQYLYLTIMSCLLRSIVTVIVLHIVQKACKDNIYSGGAFLLYSCVIYNQISVIKYSVNYFYDGAISSIYLRVFGSIFIDFVIILGSVFFYFYHIHFCKNKNFKNKQCCFIVANFVVYPAVIVYALVNMFYTKTTGKIFSTDVSRTMRTFTNLFTYFVYAISIIYISKDNGKYNYMTFIPLLIVSIVNLYITMVTGKKNIFIVFGVVTICGMLITNKISFKILKLIAFSSSLLLQIVQISSEAISSREWYNTEHLLQYHAFRFDLSDFAITISENFDKIDKPFSVVTESLEYSIPSFMFPNKKLELSNYANSMYAVGLNPNFDFNDTFFSMGAQIGGYYGVVVVFVLILLFFELLSLKLLTIRNGLSIVVLLIPYFATSESDWSMFFFQTRDLIIYIFVSYILFYFIVTKRELRSNQYDIYNCS